MHFFGNQCIQPRQGTALFIGLQKLADIGVVQILTHPCFPERSQSDEVGSVERTLKTVTIIHKDCISSLQVTYNSYRPIPFPLVCTISIYFQKKLYDIPIKLMTLWKAASLQDLLNLHLASKSDLAPEVLHDLGLLEKCLLLGIFKNNHLFS